MMWNLTYGGPDNEFTDYAGNKKVYRRNVLDKVDDNTFERIVLNTRKAVNPDFWFFEYIKEEEPEVEEEVPVSGIESAVQFGELSVEPTDESDHASL
jgi:hypothetical protein